MEAVPEVLEAVPAVAARRTRRARHCDVSALVIGLRIRIGNRPTGSTDLDTGSALAKNLNRVGGRGGVHW